MSRAKSAGPSNAKARARKTRLLQPATRVAARRRSDPRGAAAEKDDSLNPALFGIDDGRGAGDAAEVSVEDPLRDWPEGAAPEDDEWLLQRGGQGMQKPEE